MGDAPSDSASTALAWHHLPSSERIADSYHRMHGAFAIRRGEHIHNLGVERAAELDGVARLSQREARVTA
jgi:hypothetical protein